MISNIFKLFFTVLLIIPSLTYSQDKFCYRDDFGNLECKDDLEDIPLVYKNKAFFKPTLKTSIPREIRNPQLINQEIQTENRNKPSKLPEVTLPSSPEDTNQSQSNTTSTNPQSYSQNHLEGGGKHTQSMAY